MAIAQLIDDCLENPPKERPTARQAHDIIKGCLTSLPTSPPQQVRKLPKCTPRVEAATRTRQAKGLSWLV